MSGPSNVVAFKRPTGPLAYAPGVPPFDRSNPDHVRAWNTMVQLGRSEQRARALREREGE